jgi:hypothetical protein
MFQVKQCHPLAHRQSRMPGGIVSSNQRIASVAPGQYCRKQYFFEVLRKGKIAFNLGNQPGSLKSRDDESSHVAGFETLHSKLKIGGNLTNEQRRELLSVASKCPVSKLMTSVQTIIDTFLVE